MTKRSRKFPELKYYDPRNIDLHVHPYGVELHIFINRLPAEVMDALGPLNAEERLKTLGYLSGWNRSQETLDGRMFSIHIARLVVLIHAEPMGFADFIGTLTHELLHVVSKVLQERGIHLDNSSEEAYAYLQQDLLERTLRAISSNQ